jgi:hypothetical protein
MIVIMMIIAVSGITLYFSTSGGTSTASSIGSTSTTSIKLTTSSTTSTSTASKVSSPAAGAFLYLWYGEPGLSGPGSPGWNGSSHPGGGTVVDKPDTGFYTSDSNTTFAWQVNQMKLAGFSFAVISWWGPSNANESGLINKATHDFFAYLKSSGSTFKAAVMIDAYNQSNNLSPSSLTTDYNYVYNTFVKPYGSWYFDWENKPLLLFFNPIYPSYDDSNFTVRTIGNYACEPVNACPNQGLNQKLDWVFWDAPAQYFQGQSGNMNATNDEGQPVFSADGEVTLVPRIDSYFDRGYEGGSYLRFDSNLSQGLYQEQWSYVLNNTPEVKLVLVYSWNEYHERTAIEPHQDLTAHVNPVYLLNLTARYIALSKAATYLASNYNSKVGLLYETPGSNTYWLYTDNYVGASALRQVGFSNPTLTAIADNISATIQFYAARLGSATNQYMVLSGSWNSNCGFNSSRSYTVAESPGIQINVTLNNSTSTLRDSDYADIAFLTAICLQHQGNYSGALATFSLGASFFDGSGFVDQPFILLGPSHGQYQTYKLALYLYASRLLSQPVNQAALTMLLKMQAPDGGFYTGYYADLTHGSTLSNTETTSLAILALSG